MKVYPSLCCSVFVCISLCTGYAGGDCKSNTDCSKDEYCQTDTGNCGAVGQCRPRPVACVDIWDPVCGCDGKTYSNACYAAMAGVSVDYEGQCLASGCTSNDACQQGYFCYKEAGDCDGQGVCTALPSACPDLWDPVCGCDGTTYGNACYAAMAGVNVAYEGGCARVCTSNDDCDAEHYCAKAVGDCQGQGSCASRPIVCPRVWDPVCGCDGRTYGNACEAAAAGVSLSYAGPCMPAGPVIVMMEPRTVHDDVHTGLAGLDPLRILWSEPIIFDGNDIDVVDEAGLPVAFSAGGSESAIMTIVFAEALIHDRYTVTIGDTVVGAETGYAIDGDENGAGGGDAVVFIEHRKRSDLDNNNRVNLADLAYFADNWLGQF